MAGATPFRARFGIQSRVVTYADSATITPNANTSDICVLTSLSQTSVIANPITTNPYDGQGLLIRISSAVSRVISFGTLYQSTARSLPTATTGNGIEDYIEFKYNALDVKWDLINTSIINPIANGSITPAKLSQPFSRGTAVSLSGVSVDFTGIPSWARRITVSLKGASTTGTGNYILKLGSGTIQSTGYTSSACAFRANATASVQGTSTVGLLLSSDIFDATFLYTGSITLLQIDTNIWASNSYIGDNVGVRYQFGNGFVTLSGALDRIRCTTEVGTDTFDAGLINIFWEG